MTSYIALFNKLYASLPFLLDWMNRLLESSKSEAMPIVDFKFKKIKIVFPKNLLKRTKIVIVFNDVPIPPLRKIGLQEFSELERLNAIGITYKDTIFLKNDQCTEINCFHEMIHIVQWNQLGVERFLMAYGLGIALNGYEKNPFEQMAYTFQKKLETNALPMNFLKSIRMQTNENWVSLNPLNHLQNWQTT